MKRLSWMMSIACFLPAVMAIPSQASSFAAQGVSSAYTLGQAKLVAQAPVEAPAPSPPEAPAKPASDSGRRFLRSARPCNCGAAEQAALDKAKAEATAFLESVKTPNASQLGQPTPAAGASVPGPTW
jgi:hypothetical protein